MNGKAITDKRVTPRNTEQWGCILLQSVITRVADALNVRLPGTLTISLTSVSQRGRFTTLVTDRTWSGGVPGGPPAAEPEVRLRQRRVETIGDRHASNGHSHHITLMTIINPGYMA